jgi:hypothetical protein
MRTIEELRILLNELKNKVRQDQKVHSTIYEALIMVSIDIEKALEKMKQAEQIDKTKAIMLYERAKRFSLMLEEIKRSATTDYPAYLDDFLPSIADAPYTMPRKLYEPQGLEQISVNVEGQMNAEKAELALATLFPGSVTYRYSAPPVKILTGSWFQSGRAHLSSLHELSPKPEFKLKVGDKIFEVYKPLTLRAFRMDYLRPICVSCLSLGDGDETCTHTTLQPRAKLPYNSPVIRRAELSRNVFEDKTLQKPMSLLIPKITFLRETEIGLALMGFERTAAVRGGSRTVRVNYDPPIGIRLRTSGLSFKVDIPRGFENWIMDSNLMLRRDLILQLLSDRLADIMGDIGLPPYHHEPLLSALISATSLDGPMDEKTMMSKLKSEALISDVEAALNRELRFYESAPPDRGLVERAITILRDFTITENTLRGRLRGTVLHSLAHVLLLATAVTSSSQLEDLDYLINVENDEIVIFDAASGGNGSSETAFEFLSETGKFSIKEYLESEEREEIYRPRNFAETFFEILLPCINSVSDRIFLFGKMGSDEKEIKRKLNELRDKETTHEEAVRRIRERGYTSIFPIGIGYHGVDYSDVPQEADRFKEVANICLHGCPECISISKKCQLGSFYEKYGISKIILDELLKYLMREATLSDPASSKIIGTLSEHGFAILKGSCDDKKTSAELVNRLNSQVLSLVGQEVDGGHIKFTGHWADVQLDSGKLIYYFMLMVV